MIYSCLNSQLEEKKKQMKNNKMLWIMVNVFYFCVPIYRKLSIFYNNLFKPNSYRKRNISLHIKNW